MPDVLLIDIKIAALVTDMGSLIVNRPPIIESRDYMSPLIFRKVTMCDDDFVLEYIVYQSILYPLNSPNMVNI